MLAAGSVAPAAQVRPAARCRPPVGCPSALPPELATTIPAAGMGKPQQDYAGWRRGE